MPIYVHTVHGKKYHDASCRYVTGRTALSGMSGLEPCQHCLRFDKSGSSSPTTADIKTIGHGGIISETYKARQQLKWLIRNTISSEQFFDTVVVNGKQQLVPNAQLQARIDLLSNDLFREIDGSQSFVNAWHQSRQGAIVTEDIIEDALACSIICYDTWRKQHGRSEAFMQKVYYGLSHIVWKKTNKDARTGGYFLPNDENNFAIYIDAKIESPVWAIVHELAHYLAWHPENGLDSTGFYRASSDASENAGADYDDMQSVELPYIWTQDNVLNEACTNWLAENVMLSWTDSQGQPVYDIRDRLRRWNAYHSITSGFATIVDSIGTQKMSAVLDQAYWGNEPHVFEAELIQETHDEQIMWKIHRLLTESYEEVRNGLPSSAAIRHERQLARNLRRLFAQYK